MALEKKLKRKLVAILAGDVVGYSRLVADNEELAIQNWTSYRAYISEVVEDHQGRLFNTAGDSLVFEFGSIQDALRCAIEIQQFLSEVNQGVPDERQMLMRFGLHLGDVVVDRENFLGDGINIAARLESLANPGGICVSEMVYSNLAANAEFSFEDLGEKNLKNILRPLRVYQLEINGVQPSSALSADSPENKPEDGGLPSVAVLPFDNLGADRNDDYFVDGLTEDIITALAAWRSFPVIARNSTFAYKGKSPDVRAVARDLGARYVLEGSVRKGDRRVRINAQFVDATSGHHLWAEKFDRQAEDVFDLQDEITHHIAATIAPELEMAERARVIAVRPKDMNAWDYCLRGRALLGQFTPDGNSDARKMFEKAIELDPAYSGGYVGLAYSHHRDLWFEAADCRDRSIQAQLNAARQAVALEQENSEAHCILGFGLIWDRQFQLAIAAGERAVKINPSNAFAFSQLGIAQSYAGRPELGIANLERSLHLNPQDPRVHFVITMIARAYLNARNPEEGARWAETAVHRRSDYPLSHLVHAAALGHLGCVNEARAAWDLCEHLEPGFATRWVLRPMYKDPTDDLYFLEGLRKAGLDARTATG